MLLPNAKLKKNFCLYIIISLHLQTHSSFHLQGYKLTCGPKRLREQYFKEALQEMRNSLTDPK